MTDIPAGLGRELGVAELGQVRLAATQTGQGMNLISAAFDIVVVDHLNEQMHGKHMVDLLGKKCYREFVKREDVCPGCPGKLALATGQTHTAELEGLRDNGTRYTISCTAYPVIGPAGEPLGFVEVEEDITEKKRSEQLNLVLARLRNALKTIYDDSTALRAGLNAALALEGIECGSSYKIDPTTKSRILVSQRGTPQGWLDSLPPMIPESGQIELRFSPSDKGLLTDDSGSRRSIALVVPIVSRGETVAKLVLGLHGSGEIPWTTKVALESVRQEIGDFIGQAGFDRWQKKTAHEVEFLMSALPIAMWRVDTRGRVTMWNPAAEELFGWEAGEVIGSRIPLVPIGGAEEFKEVLCPNRLLKSPAEYRLLCLQKAGEPVSCTITGMPFGAAVSDGSAVVFLAKAEARTDEPHVDVDPRREDGAGLTGEPSRLTEIAGESRPRVPQQVAESEVERPPVVLFADHDSESRRALRRIFDELGCRSVDCSSAEEAVVHFRSGFETEVRFALVIVELIMPKGLDGLAAGRQILKIDPGATVALACEWPVVGHRQHGFVGAIKKPYDKQEVQSFLSVSPRPARMAAAP